jgi:redox-sensitive bicupin YhaK (pirin superfamily)
MTEPKYQNIENEDLAKVNLGNGIGSIDIIAGEFETTKVQPLHFHR